MTAVPEGDWVAAQKLLPGGYADEELGLEYKNGREEPFIFTKEKKVEHLKDLFGEHKAPPEFWKDPARFWLVQTVLAYVWPGAPVTNGQPERLLLSWDIQNGTSTITTYKNPAYVEYQPPPGHSRAAWFRVLDEMTTAELKVLKDMTWNRSAREPWFAQECASPAAWLAKARTSGTFTCPSIE